MIRVRISVEIDGERVEVEYEPTVATWADSPYEVVSGLLDHGSEMVRRAVSLSSSVMATRQDDGDSV